jgi:hypothetical protein
VGNQYKGTTLKGGDDFWRSAQWKLTREELSTAEHIGWRRMLVRESPGGHDGWLIVQEGVGHWHGAGGGAGTTGEVLGEGR